MINNKRRWMFTVLLCVGALSISTGCRSTAHMVAGSGGGVQLGPVDIELRSYGQRLPCFVRGGQFYVVGRRGMPYSIWIHNRTPRRLEVMAAVDGRDVITGRRQTNRSRGYILNPYRHVNITGYRTSMRSVAAFRFSAIHRSYSARMGSTWFKVGSIRVSIFTERENRVLIPRPLVQHRRRHNEGRPSILHKRSYPIRPPQRRPTRKYSIKGVRPERYGHSRTNKVPRRSNDTAGGVRSHPIPQAKSRSSVRSRSFGGMAKSLPRSRSHGYHHPAPREGLGTAFGQKKSAPAKYTSFVRASPQPSYALNILYNNCAGYRYLKMCTPWCPCFRQPRAYVQPQKRYGSGFSSAP